MMADLEVDCRAKAMLLSNGLKLVQKLYLLSPVSSLFASGSHDFSQFADDEVNVNFRILGKHLGLFLNKLKWFTFQ